MDILVLTIEYPPVGGGGASVVQAVSRGYVARGHVVRVVTMACGDLPRHEWDGAVEVLRVPSLRRSRGVSHPWEQAAFLASATQMLGGLVRERRPDVVHCHFIVPTGLLALMLKRRFGIPYVVSAHGSDVLGYNSRFSALYPLLRLPWRAIVHGATAVTAPSSGLLENITAQARVSRPAVVPHGVDVAAGASVATTKDQAILVVGRLQPSKAIGDVIQAFGRSGLSSWRLDVVGEGPLRSSLEAQTRELGLADRVRFHGWLDRQGALAERYDRAAVYCSASRLESFGLTVIEGMAAGCRPIVSDIPAHRDIVSDKESRFPPGDVAALAKLMQAAALHAPRPELSDELSRFAWPTIIERYLELLAVPR